MEEYEALARYASDRPDLGEDFFLGRMRSVRESVEERELRIRQRDEISRQNVAEIDAERVAKEGRLRLLAASYAQERNTLSNSIDSLRREERSERLSRLKDVAAWEREKRDKLEEYEGVSQLFRAMAVSERNQK